MDKPSLEPAPLMILTTSVTGNLEVHVEGCRHIPRLYAAGGGALASGSLEEMIYPSPGRDGTATEDCRLRARRTKIQSLKLFYLVLVSSQLVDFLNPSKIGSMSTCGVDIGENQPVELIF
jgi:hypothetical protein